MSPTEKIYQQDTVIVSGTQSSDLSSTVSGHIGNLMVITIEQVPDYLETRFAGNVGATLIHTDAQAFSTLSPDILDIQKRHNTRSRNILAASVTESQIHQLRRDTELGFAQAKFEGDPTPKQIDRLQSLLDSKPKQPVST